MSTLEDKIAALLAKAEATPYPHEAEAFMAKAEELMLKHGIERAMLESREGPGAKKQEIIVRQVHIPDGTGYANAFVSIGHAIGSSFSVKTLQSNLSNSSRVLWIIGHKSDVEDAEALFLSLKEQAHKQAVHWWKTEGKALRPQATDNDAYLARREFIFAFASGVRARLAETRNRIVDEAPTGTALVLVDRAKLVDEWVDSNIQTSKGRRTSRRDGGYEARRAGNQAGREAVTSKALK